MTILKVIFAGTISLLFLTFTTVTTIHFMYFLSSFPNITDEEAVNATLITDSREADVISKATWSVFIDILLLCVFIIQHSFIGTIIGKITSALTVQYLERLIFNFLTSLVLQILMYLWQPIPNYVLWAIDAERTNILTLFQLCQILAWFVIYIISISLDVTEILGIKQVYYHLTGRNIMIAKSDRMQHLQKSVQHPSFVGFLVIFWVFPVMRLDRLFMAVIWTVYMALAWNPDENDYNYVIEQRARKFHNTS